MIRLACFLTLLLATTFAFAGERETSRSFRVTLASNVTMTFPDKSQKMEADTNFNYTWKQKGQERTLFFDLLSIRAAFDGKEVMNTIMSKEKLMTFEAGQKREVAIEDAPEQLQEMLRDSFQSPLCKVNVDETGKETKREILSKPGAKDLHKQGLVENVQFFHPPYPPDKEEWTAVNEVSMGNGGFAKGPLTYKKVAGGKAGQKVAVSGTLGNDGFDLPGQNLRIQKAKYVVSGEQVYDTASREWISAKLKIDVSFEMASPTKAIVTAKGALNVTHQKLPSAK